MRNSSTYIALLLCLLLVSGSSFAEEHALSWDWWPTYIHFNADEADTLTYHGCVNAVASSGNYVPFWLHTNTFSITPHLPYSGSVLLGIDKKASSPSRWYDYDFHVAALARVHSNATNLMSTGFPAALTYPMGGVALPVAYAHVRLYIFDFTAGIAPLMPLMADSSLSMGGLLFSPHAPTFPRVSIGIDRYVPFPGCYGYFELKGGLTHAWLTDNVLVQRAMLHHKFIGFRFGGKLPVNLSYEFHHAAQWGGTHPTYGDLGNNLRAYVNIFFARAGGSMANDQLNAQGNHITSQQLMLTAKGTDWQIDAYWQNISEDNLIFIGFGQNIVDGLWGVNLRLNNQPWVQSVVYEFLNTTDQSGPWHDRDGLCFAGNDSYYRNRVYGQGWNSYLHTMGNPFLSSPYYNADGTLYTLNSRVRVHHIGVRGEIYGFQYRLRASYARNYGNSNSRVHPLTTNTALCLDLQRTIQQAWGLTIGLSLAADFGSQFGNTCGAQLTISKSGLLANW